MRPIWRTASIVAASVATVAILAVGMLAYMFWPHCDGEEKALATNRNGQSIVSVFRACTSIGTRVIAIHSTGVRYRRKKKHSCVRAERWMDWLQGQNIPRRCGAFSGMDRFATYSNCDCRA